VLPAERLSCPSPPQRAFSRRCPVESQRATRRSRSTSRRHSCSTVLMSAAASGRQAAAVLVGRLPRPHLRARRVRRGSSPPRRPDRDRDAAVRPRAAAIRHARRPSDRRNAWLCNSRSVGTRVDLQRAPDDLLRFPFAAVAPTSCRTPSCTLTLVRSGQSSSPAARAIDRRTNRVTGSPAAFPREATLRTAQRSG